MLLAPELAPSLAASVWQESVSGRPTLRQKTRVGGFWRRRQNRTRRNRPQPPKLRRVARPEPTKTASVHTLARYYEPTSGRFLSADPAGHASSPSLYDFAGGDPVNNFDPDGRCAHGDGSPFNFNTGLIPTPGDPIVWGQNPNDPNLGGIVGRAQQWGSLGMTDADYQALADALGMGGNWANLGESEKQFFGSTAANLLQRQAAGYNIGEQWSTVVGSVPGLAMSDEQRLAFAMGMGAVGVVTGITTDKEGGPIIQPTAAKPPSIATPYAIEEQSPSEEAQAALAQAQNGATLYRTGQTGVSMTGESQYWTLENPQGPGFANGLGTPPEVQPDFVMTGKLNPGATVITNEAPGLGTNTGGGIQVVTAPGGVGNLGFHMP